MAGRTVTSRRWGATLLASLVVLTACGSAGESQTAARGAESTATVAVESTAIVPDPPAEPSASSTSQPPTPDPTAVPRATPTAPTSECVRLDDFAPGAADRWRVVNDGVMGGRSDGVVQFVDGTMRFSGTIDTNGGGFSSVRAVLAADGLGDAAELRLRARADGRTYELIADDLLAGRDRRVSHFALIPLQGTGSWEEVTVALADLDPRVFGTPVDDASFRPDLATSIGVILADGADGSFLLEVDWIDACA